MKVREMLTIIVFIWVFALAIAAYFAECHPDTAKPCHDQTQEKKP